MRQLYAVYARNVVNDKVCITGPFKTKPAARKAGREWDGADDVAWRVVPLTYCDNSRGELVTLPYDRLYDPALRKRCGACKQPISQQEDDGAE